MITNQFGQVHVTQDTHHGFLFGIGWVLTFECAQCTQDGENISKTEIVVNLFGQLFFAKFVERVEFLRQFDVLQETATGQFDTHDDSTIRDHHR